MEWQMAGAVDLRTTTLSYLSLPALARVHIASRPLDVHLVAGAHASFLFSAGYAYGPPRPTRLPISDESITDQVPPLDAGVIGGIQMTFNVPFIKRASRGEVELRFGQSITSIEPVSGYRNTQFTTYLRLF